MHKEIFKNTTYQVFARVVTTAIGFIITILLAKSFGSYLFGEFSKITSYVALFYLFVDFGLNAIFIRQYKSFSSLFYLRILMSVVFLVAANIISFALPYNSSVDIGFSPFVRMGIFIFSFTIFSQSIIFSTAGVFQKKLKFDFYMISQIVGEIINLFIIVILIFFAKSLEFVLISFVVSNFITAFLSLFLAKEKILGWDIKYSKEIFMMSIPIGLMMIFNLIYFRIDIILLSIFKSNQDVATYSLAYRFFDFLIALPLFLSNSIYPKLLENLKDKINFSRITSNYVIVYLLLSILIIIPVWFLSPLFGFVGRDYLSSITPFRILLISLPLFFLTSFLQWILISLNKQEFLMKIYFVSMALNIILNFIFIPKFSYIASSWITGAGELFVFITFVVKLKKEKIYLKNGN